MDYVYLLEHRRNWGERTWQDVDYFDRDWVPCGIYETLERAKIEAEAAVQRRAGRWEDEFEYHPWHDNTPVWNTTYWWDNDYQQWRIVRITPGTFSLSYVDTGRW